ncbi:MAG: lysine biosynthesis protein LysW [Cellvibrionaceae bacterium]|jgi:lysine biosynthesis protein LysW
MNKKSPAIVECPVCSDEIKFRRPPYAGRKMDCPHCFAELQVTSIDPLYLEDIDFVGSYNSSDDWDKEDWN